MVVTAEDIRYEPNVAALRMAMAYNEIISVGLFSNVNQCDKDLKWTQTRGTDLYGVLLKEGRLNDDNYVEADYTGYYRQPFVFEKITRVSGKNQYVEEDCITNDTEIVFPPVNRQFKAGRWFYVYSVTHVGIFAGEDLLFIDSITKKLSLEKGIQATFSERNLIAAYDAREIF